MRMRNTRSMKAARVAVAAAALFTAAPFVASQSAGAVEQGMAAPPWRIGFADVVQKVRPAVFSISVKVVEETHGRAKPRHGASVGSGFFISPDGYAVTDAHVVRPEHATALSTQIRMPDGDVYDAEPIDADQQTGLRAVPDHAGVRPSARECDLAHSDAEQRRRRSAAARRSRRGRRSVIQYSSYQRGFTGKGDIGCLQ
jgi:hypothetical protein